MWTFRLPFHDHNSESLLKLMEDEEAVLDSHRSSISWRQKWQWRQKISHNTQDQFVQWEHLYFPNTDMEELSAESQLGKKSTWKGSFWGFYVKCKQLWWIVSELNTGTWLIWTGNFFSLPEWQYRRGKLNSNDPF